LITSPFHNVYDDLDVKALLRIARDTHRPACFTSCNVYLYWRRWKGDMISYLEK